MEGSKYWLIDDYRETVTHLNRMDNYEPFNKLKAYGNNKGRSKYCCKVGTVLSLIQGAQKLYVFITCKFNRTTVYMLR
jgi:hypothetical protein